MVKEFDPDKRLRDSQNLLTLTIMYGGVVMFFVYIAMCSTIFTILGKRDLIAFVTSKPKDQIDMGFYMLKYYWNYWWMYKAHLMPTTQHFFVIKLFLSSLIPLSTLIFLVIRFWELIQDFRPFQKEQSIHGDSHWASEKEIKKMGLRSKKGMLMGQNDKGYLVAGGYQHTLLFAPTGSGKGVGFVIPNLLFWEESVICHDIKLENYELTSGWRHDNLKQSVFVWEPSNPDGVTHAYNPVDWVSSKPGQMVDDVQKMSNLILQKKEFWENEARTLLVGVLLYLIADDTKTKSFGEVVRTLRGDDFAYSMAVALDTMGDKIHPVGYMNLAAFLQKADKERSGVVSTLNSGLELWANPLIDAATARSDFNVQTFKKKQTTVFVGLTPDNIQRLKSLMAMFYQQSSDFLSKKMPGKDEPYGVMYLMDEFPTVGKLEQFLAGIAYYRGYHVRLFLIVQDTQQLKGTYEAAGMNSFLSNSTYRITFAANNVETAELISKMVGNTTVESTSYSKPKFFDLNASSRSMNVSGTQRALLLPQEVMMLPKDEQIILIEASPPIKTRKIKYYEDKMFTSRLWKQIERPKQEPVIKRRGNPQQEQQPQNDNQENQSGGALSE